MYHNSKHTVFLPLILAVCVAAGVVLGQFLGRSSAESHMKGIIGRMASASGNKLTYTMQLIERGYVDSVSMDSLTEHILPLLVGELDPHSVYIPASEMQEMNEPLEGEFDGIGVVFNMSTDTVVVLNVIPSGPSDRAGVRAGDRIVRIDDSIVAGRRIPQNDIVKRLRGPRGTEVRLSLDRRGIGDAVEVTVVRDAIPLKSVDAVFMIDDKTGYARLSKFARTSYDELTAAMSRLRAEGMERFILDLRGNTGGFLDQAILIANEFLPEGRLIVYTEDRARNRMSEYSDGTGASTDIALAVLVDEESASSSEILAGALQDNDRGIIVGRRTFGKGLVQNQIPYPDGSALRLTVARYYTPSGRSIQKPYTNGDDASYQLDIWNRYEHSEFFSADSIRFDDSLRYTTVGGRTVYGGGGIMPDEFVPLDTTRMSRYFIEVSGRNIIYRYTMEYADRHREALNSVRTVDDLRALLDADRTLFDDFVAYAARQGVRPVRREIELSRDIITAQLRAYIGRNTQLEDTGFYASIYPIDDVAMRAIEILRTQTDNSDD
ncbi:MAG: S41 family peptidase [Alistipes sp.]|nr:S41 family peptidase [Alistipes sp.]MDE6857757.1 S41 family peptidase [Alistipes sp.]